MARGRPGTVRTPPIILFSLPDASLGSPPLSSFSLRRNSACTSLSLALFHSRPLHRPSVSLTAPFSTRIVSLSPFLERVLLSPSISYSIVLSLPLSLSLLFVFLLLLLLLFRRLLALFFLVSCARTRESTRVRNVFLSLSPALSVRQGTVKRQLTIGAIHGLLARINCRRKLLRLCRVRVESSRESERTRARGTARERCFFFFTAARGITIHSASPHFHGEH